MLKILIVEDEQDLAQMVKKRLENLQYLVLLASDGVDAMEKMKSFRPDIIILDIHMPRMDGYRFLEEIRGDDSPFKHIEVIVLTARKKMKDAFDPNSISAFMEKPFESKELIAKVEEIGLRLRKQRQTVYRALVVGMDWDAMRPIIQLLQSREFIVFSATDGHQALELAVQKKPNIVVCGSLLAGMDVFSLCQLVKDLPSTKDAPFVIYDSAGSLNSKMRDTIHASKIIDYKDHNDLVTRVDDYLKDFFLQQ